ncbi:universal stress protein [Methylocapsa polymorpha]|uniref:Universal stress protein n=1 Tax=Methylocapsa polymorpha TaxID=3080828 RepID=A0ABZ0HXA0_9HYPH|nr:universal stress protein [Methylocapsa sp. RX1]
MPFKSVCLGLSFGEVTPKPLEESGAAENYAIAFCALERAHLSVLIAAPIFRIPSAGFVPLAHAVVDEINAERRLRAEDAEKRITTAAATAGVTVEFQIVQQSYPATNNSLAVAARPSDIVIISRPTYGFSLDSDLISAMLFTSGRPVLVIPPYWDGGVEFDKIMIAWDGSARAARAVGDALPLLTRAQQIEILCVSPDASKSIAGADLAAHLSRHSKSVTVTELQTEHRDVAKTLRDHATMARASMLVMGAYAHPHLLQMVLGGVTSDMLTEAELPVLLSY